MPHGGRKNADEVLVLALACGATVEKAAHKAGVSARTAHRRRAGPAFRGRVQAARGDLVQRTGGMLTAAGGEAVKTLLALLQEGVSAAVRAMLEERAVKKVGKELRQCGWRRRGRCWNWASRPARRPTCPSGSLLWKPRWV